MKNFAKLFVVALIVALVASVFAIVPMATDTVYPDPNALKPGSDMVYYVMDAPEGGEIPGDGSGTSPENPLKPIDHEEFDHAADKPKYYLQTALYQAMELLENTGGTVVLVGPVRLYTDNLQDSNPDDNFHFPKNGENTIKFTCKYNGVDYRETNGAKLILDDNAIIHQNGQFIWEHIDIVTGTPDRKIFASRATTLFGEGINCYPLDEEYEGVAAYYVSITPGHRYESAVDSVYSMVVKSGTYNIVNAALWGVKNIRGLNPDGSVKWTYNDDGNTRCKLVLEGETTVLGSVLGTTRVTAEFSGNTQIIINGGTYPCDIYAIGDTGMINTDGQASITINGGDFTDCWAIAPAMDDVKNNVAAYSLLDLSGFKGDMNSLAAAYNATLDYVYKFTEIKLPEGVTADQLANHVPETDAPETEETDAPEVEDTKAPEADKNDKKPGGAVGVGEGEGMNLGLIIGIAAAAVVVIAAVVVVIIVSKKKKAKKTEENK